jgi:hypothetical protein
VRRPDDESNLGYSGSFSASFYSLPLFKEERTLPLPKVGSNSPRDRPEAISGHLEGRVGDAPSFAAPQRPIPARTGLENGKSSSSSPSIFGRSAAHGEARPGVGHFFRSQVPAGRGSWTEAARVCTSHTKRWLVFVSLAAEAEAVLQSTRTRNRRHDPQAWICHCPRRGEVIPDARFAFPAIMISGVY